MSSIAPGGPQRRVGIHGPIERVVENKFEARCLVKSASSCGGDLGQERGRGSCPRWATEIAVYQARAVLWIGIPEDYGRKNHWSCIAMC